MPHVKISREIKRSKSYANEGSTTKSNFTEDSKMRHIGKI